LLTAADGSRWVLRKKPPGHLLRGAHQIEREYRVINALQDTRVPVPRTVCLCEDDAVIGTPFYIMEFMNGRVFDNSDLKELPEAERTAVYASVVDTMVALHAVDYKAVGLEGFGRDSGYVQRQTRT
jgi:acyl-CoA dehydrogenase